LHTGFILLVLAASAASVLSEFQSSESRLMKRLLNGYNNQFRPYNVEYENKTLVSMGMTLSQIISVKEKSQELTTSVYMTFDWVDNRFSWDPEEYEGITIIRIPPYAIWSPRIVLQNSIDGNFDVSVPVMALIKYTGEVQWIPPGLYKSTCTIVVALFPFDWQNCTMVFRSATYDRSEMEFGLSYGDSIYVDPEAFKENGEWKIVQRPVRINSDSSDPTYQDVTFYLIIRRKPQFYVINLIIPCILMSSLSCFVFYLPSVSCEKMTLSISVLLGETVFLFLIAQRVPETSLAVPLIAGYLLFVMILVIISVISSVVVCNVHYRSNTTHSMPDWVVWFFMEKLAPILRVERPSEEESGACSARPRRCSSVSARKAMRQRKEWKSPSEIMFDHQASRLGFRRRHVVNHYGMTEVNVASPENDFEPAAESINYIANQLKEENDSAQSKDDWGYVALILDRILLWIYFAAFSLGTLFFFLQSTFAYYPEQ
uniref:Neurotransmitter-gated ion-channel ligand-binding domain-containing protein n=1 Tax=Ciona savignyi TaxID=51511 RepID=H2Y827_CIOSA